MRRTKEEWADIVRSHAESGLNVHQYCLAERVGEQSLRNWKRRLDGTSKRTPPHVSGGFIEILPDRGIPALRTAEDAPGPGTTETRSGVLIRFPGGIRVDVQPGADRATLELVLDLLDTHR